MYTDSDAKAWTEKVRDTSYGDSLLEVWRAYPDVFAHVREVIKYVDPDDEAYGVIDLGCGTGQFLYVLSNIRHYGRVIGVNLFQSQLDMAVNKVGIEFYQQDIREPFHYDDIDLAFMNHVSGHLTDEEILDVLDKLNHMGVKQLAMWEITPKDITVDTYCGYKMRSARHWERLFHNGGWEIARWQWCNNAVMSQNFIENASPDEVKLALRTTNPLLMVAKPREIKKES